MALTNFYPGVSVANPASAGMGPETPLFDPVQHVVFFDDFFRYNAADWVITTTEAGAGSATEALIDGHGGLLLITNDAADNDLDFFQNVKESFRFALGRKAWFKTRFKVSDATQSDVVIGLQITDTTALDVTDGVFFLKADGVATMDFIVEKDGTQSTITSAATLVSDTFITLAFYFDGLSTFQVYVNDVPAGKITTTANMPNDEDVTVSFGIQNGEAVAKTMTVDFILAAMER